MSLKRRLGALEAREQATLGIPAEPPPIALELLHEELVRQASNMPVSGSLPVRAQELLCKAIARRPADTPPAVIEALLASRELGEDHKDLLRCRQRGERLPWPQD